MSARRLCPPLLIAHFGSIHIFRSSTDSQDNLPFHINPGIVIMFLRGRGDTVTHKDHRSLHLGIGSAAKNEEIAILILLGLALESAGERSLGHVRPGGSHFKKLKKISFGSGSAKAISLQVDSQIPR